MKALAKQDLRERLSEAVRMVYVLLYLSCSVPLCSHANLCELHFGAENDVELGRKLRVAKSTISSWRARGVVPARYQKILEGGSQQMILTPMNIWSTEEQLAFSLALFRFNRATANLVSTGDFRDCVDLFRQSHLLILLLAIDCQNEMREFLDVRDYGAHTAFALVLHADLETGEDGIKRTRARIKELLVSPVDNL